LKIIPFLRQQDGMVDLKQTPNSLEGQDLLINDHGLNSPMARHDASRWRQTHFTRCKCDFHSAANTQQEFESAKKTIMGWLRAAVPLHNGLLRAK
jgi:hypothetical protein